MITAKGPPSQYTCCMFPDDDLCGADLYLVLYSGE